MLGTLSSLTSPELGAKAHLAALEQAGISGADIDEVLTGCVLQAGIGQAPGRQAAIAAGIPDAVPATTINKMCGSGMKAIMLGFDAIKAGSAHVVLASGMESMSNAPYLLSKARVGYRLGHGELKDHMFLDGLEDAYDKGRLMGYFADATAKHYHFSREEQDAYAERSMRRALEAENAPSYKKEVVPVTFTDNKGQSHTVSVDEGPDEAKLAKIPKLRPAFQENGTVTAANSSSISDGAASLILMTYAHAKNLNVKPIARIVAHSSHAQAPQWFTTAPIEAIRTVMSKAGWTRKDVDLYEINEAFAVVAMAAIRDLELDSNQVNIHGGACALGHPIGASGARILVTLIYALEATHKKRGIASLCIGGGEAVAVAIELV
jgi:acetyl-CoA C-acetyltransferase